MNVAEALELALPERNDGHTRRLGAIVGRAWRTPDTQAAASSCHLEDQSSATRMRCG